MNNKNSFKHSILFVCYGNICRSPMAEMIFQQIVKERGILQDWYIDSAATSGWHIGDSPDSRTINILKKHYPNTQVTHKGRKINEKDFYDFEYILCMDEDNLRELKKIKPKNSKAIVKLLGSYDPQGELIIEDPYYGGLNNFEYNFQQITRCCYALLDSIS
jgi:low molecular weight phosphotyrosine protein phosphatase